jgi:ribosomal protein S18 acetylase RimI-like enzyme
LATDAITVRPAGIADAGAAARLLHEFNTEFDAFTPGVAPLEARLRELLAAGETIVLLGGDGPDGVAVLRLRPTLWTEGREAYLEELYVAPERRGRGLGRALLEAAMASACEAGAVRMDLGTGETDTAARYLYESAGFSNREDEPDGARTIMYERDL